MLISKEKLQLDLGITLQPGTASEDTQGHISSC